MKLKASIAHWSPRSKVTEAYRTLRTNIQYADFNHNLRTLAVVSANAGEGKSTTVANLSITLAQAGKKVLVVDSNLRRPVLRDIFQVQESQGLTSVLMDEIRLEEVIENTGVAGIRIIPSGPLPPNPSELLGSARMIQLIEEMKEYADVVIFDTPPIMSVTDAVVLSTKVDGVIMVLHSGHVPVKVAQRALMQLKKVGVRIFGAVLNTVESNREKQHYHYYPAVKNEVQA